MWSKTYDKSIDCRVNRWIGEWNSSLWRLFFFQTFANRTVVARVTDMVSSATNLIRKSIKSNGFFSIRGKKPIFSIAQINWRWSLIFNEFQLNDILFNSMLSTRQKCKWNVPLPFFFWMKHAKRLKLRQNFMWTLCHPLCIVKYLRNCHVIAPHFDNLRSPIME